MIEGNQDFFYAKPEKIIILSYGFNLLIKQETQTLVRSSKQIGNPLSTFSKVKFYGENFIWLYIGLNKKMKKTNFNNRF